MNLFDNNSGAEFSECGKYRYKLWRIWDESKPLAMCIGLNPSKANATKNDQTISYLIKMLTKLGYGGFYMMNCFPIISSKPSVLKDFWQATYSYTQNQDTINRSKLQEVATKCETVVFAWGTFRVVKEVRRDKELKEMFPNAKCFGINNDGSPFHPLAMMPRNGRDPNNPQLINYK